MERCIYMPVFPVAHPSVTKQLSRLTKFHETLLKALLNYKNITFSVGFEVLTAVVMKSSIFRDMTSFIPLKVDRHFEATCRLHLQDRRVS
jgi:hypothetical protein